MPRVKIPSKISVQLAKLFSIYALCIILLRFTIEQILELTYAIISSEVS